MWGCKFSSHDLQCITRESLRNDDGDVVDNVSEKMNLHFKISRYSEVIVLFLAVQALSKLNSEDSVKLDIEIFKNRPSSFTFSRQRKV